MTDQELIERWQKDQWEYLNTLPQREHDIIDSYIRADGLMKMIQAYLRGQSTWKIDLPYKHHTNTNLTVKTEQDLRNAIVDFDRIFTNAPPLPVDIIVYRAQPIKINVTYGYLTDLPGDTLTNPALVSTSIGTKSGKTFGIANKVIGDGSQSLDLFKSKLPPIKKVHLAKSKAWEIDLKNHCCFMHIILRKGQKTLALWQFEDGIYKHELEILLPTDAQFVFEKKFIEKVEISSSPSIVDDVTMMVFHYIQHPRYEKPLKPYPASMLLPIKPTMLGPSVKPIKTTKSGSIPPITMKSEMPLPGNPKPIVEPLDKYINNKVNGYVNNNDIDLDFIVPKKKTAPKSVPKVKAPKKTVSKKKPVPQKTASKKTVPKKKAAPKKKTVSKKKTAPNKKKTAPKKKTVPKKKTAPKKKAVPKKKTAPKKKHSKGKK
jgi:hypothetical protein